LAALVYAASLGPYLFGRQVMPDPLLTLWVALAIWGYLRATTGRGEGRGLGLWVMYTSLGLAALTKGLLGVGLPAAAVGLHAIFSGHLRALLSWRAAAGAGVVAAIALPWHLAVARANPDFLGYYVVREHLLRFTGQRYPPDEFLSLPVFLAFTLLWVFPWAALVPQAVWRAGRRLAAAGLRKGEDLLPLVWGAVIVGLFAASRSRLEYYTLPALPACALLIAKLWDEVGDGAAARPGGAPSPRALTAALGAMTAVLAVAAAGALVVLGPGKGIVFRFVAGSWPEAGWLGSPDQVAVLDRIRWPTMATLAGAAALAAGALGAVRRGRPRLACGLLAGMLAPVFALVHWGFLVVEPFQSSRALAEIVRRAARPEDPVVYEEPYEYMWVGGITFYGRRPVLIVKDPRFGAVPERRREPPDRFLDRAGLLRLWTSDHRVVVVAQGAGNLPAILHEARPASVLGQSGGRVVLRPSAPDAGQSTLDAKP
jgi:4-amino-4-deoxy-L-arabinose transferase-like glycosyltransferase